MSELWNKLAHSTTTLTRKDDVMNIITRFNLGHTFWVPRVLERYTTHSVVVDGLTYSRQQQELDIEARLRRVCKIEVTVSTEGTVVRYWAHDPTLSGDLPRAYEQEEMTFLHEQDALEFARHWRQTMMSPYHGVTHEQD